MFDACASGLCFRYVDFHNYTSSASGFGTCCKYTHVIIVEGSTDSALFGANILDFINQIT